MTETTNKLANFLKDLFGEGDLISDLKREYKPVPLKKRGNIEYEVQWHISNLEKEGHQVLHISQNRYGESVIVYRLFYDDDMDDRDITLRVKAITDKGVIVPDSDVYLIIDPDKKHMQVADIKIEGSRVNRGYGSVVMEVIMKLVDELEIKYITGWISNVDWDHIQRSEHFYKKFGFTCKLDHEIKHGTITWLNKALGATHDELSSIKTTFPLFE